MIETTSTPLVPFKSLMTGMKTGDLILMHGEFAESWMIEDFERSVWTHSGMVVRAEDIGLKGKAPDLLYWESNSLNNLTDVLLNIKKDGPMLVSLEDRVIGNAKNYNEVRMTYVALNYQFSSAQYQQFLDFIPTVHNATFPPDVKMMFDEILGRFLRIQCKKNEVFCSELVAATYEAMGLLDNKLPWNAYEPGDFAKPGKINFLQNASLQSEKEFNPLA